MRWPGSARCALCISWDVEADSLVRHRLPERGYELYAALSWLRYDEVAVPAIVETLDRYGIKQTFCVSGWCLDRYPAMCKPIVANGHEIAHHGYVHAAPNELTAERELEELQRGIDAIERFTGKRPSGWRARSHVPNLGYLMPPKSPSEAMEVFRAQFDAAYEFGGLWISIWHPHVSGRPARLLAWTKLLEYIGDVWFASLNEIARHVRSCVDAGTYEPRVVSLPYYDEPPPEFAELGEQPAPRMSAAKEVH